nr:MAG TPA: hypothetical protein [Caudoviricetes sp.]
MNCIFYSLVENKPIRLFLYSKTGGINDGKIIA